MKKETKCVKHQTTWEPKTLGCPECQDDKENNRVTVRAWAVVRGDELDFRGNANLASIFRAQATAEYEAKIRKDQCVPCVITFQVLP